MPLQQHDELVAADAEDRAVLEDAANEGAGCAEVLVARLVPGGVVDAFQPVHIENGDGKRRLAAAFDLAKAANRLADAGKLSREGAEKILGCFRDFDRVVGCFAVDTVRTSEAIPDEIVALAEARAAARKAKNFAESDRIRDELTARGYAVKDVPGGNWELKKL